MTHAEDLVARLRERHETVAIAETTAGGLATAALIAVPGASAVIPGSVVVYDNHPKMDILGVPRDLLRTHGAVSPECAAAMAEGARSVFKTTWALAETGIAGPSSGTPDKAAGTIIAALTGPTGTQIQRWLLGGGRELVMQQAADRLLDWLFSTLDTLESPKASSLKTQD